MGVQARALTIMAATFIPPLLAMPRRLPAMTSLEPRDQPRRGTWRVIPGMVVVVVVVMVVRDAVPFLQALHDPEQVGLRCLLNEQPAGVYDIVPL